MHRERTTPRRKAFAGRVLGALIVIVALSLVQGLRAADQQIDLDKNAANGLESKISTKVLSTYPVRIENTVYNNASGTGFVFTWPGAGPGGFNSFVTAGPGVGTKWVWSTVYQVYSVDSPVVFSPARGVATVGTAPRGVEPVGSVIGGSFPVQGKSIYPNQVTLSDASLSASLITFFSPEKTVASCGVECVPGECELFLENKSGGAITVQAEQLGCCPEPHNTICGGECKAYLTDTQNCGGCGNVCAADEICSDGACVCPAGQAQCGSGCIDPSTDRDNCGTCGNVCAADEQCTNGACVCDPGLTQCGSGCVDLQTTESDCGTCGNVCASDENCASGDCVCNAGLTQCGSGCVDLQSSGSNCGACGTVCNADRTCSGGACVCNPGLSDCSGFCLDLMSDPLNCGGCGAVCPAGASCTAGACACPSGQTTCGGSCLDLQNDPLNCGTCGNRCEANDICTGGRCVTCRAPTPTACGNVCVNTNTDPDNCGACGSVCDFSGCPSSGQGTCSHGTSCVCSTSGKVSTLSSAAAAPTKPVRKKRFGRKVAPAIQRVPLRASGIGSTVSRSVASVLPVTAAPTTAVKTTEMSAPFVSAEPVNQVTARSSSLNVEEAPVCDLDPIEQVIPAGGTYSQMQTGGRFGKEIQTSVSIVVDGNVVAQGPCPQIVPVTGVDTSGIILSPAAVGTRDTSGDGLCQPGEARCDYFITMASLGDTPCVNPVATLSSPPDTFNPNEISILSATASYGTLPGYPGDGIPLTRQTNGTPFSLTLPAIQASDVGRPFQVSVVCQNLPTPVLVPLTLGIGSVCNPVTRTPGEYDRVNGLQGPVNAPLVASGLPVNFSSRNFNLGSTIPLKLTLGCGASGLNDAAINPNPKIVGLDHETLGPLSLLGINGDNNANPDDPGFSCNDTACDYQFRTAAVPVGRIIISIQMPDNRVFQAGVTIAP